jgi:hypothetical protein
VTHIARHADKLIPFALALASFALYLRTLAPDVVDADGGEFQFAAWNFGFVHPTGYPLYLILGGLFQHLVPLGNPAYRLTLFTALTAALAVAVVYLVSHELTRHRGAAILAAASFALTRTFWYDASAAETYALNAFFVALLMYLALRWQSEPSTPKFAAFCFTFGLALTHHRTIVLWVPAFALFLAVSGFRFQVSRIMHYFLLFTFPFLLYLYIPLRAPASPYYTLALAPGRDVILYDNTLTGFINYVLGRTFQSEIGWDAVSVARLSIFPQLLLDQFGALGVALGVIGLGAMMWRRDWARLALLATGFIATILFASLYHIGDIFHYYIPAYLVWAIWLGMAVAWMWSNGIRNTHYVLRVAYCVLLIGIVVFQFTFNLPYADRSRETQHREQWTRILSARVPPNAILVSNDRDEMMPLWYIQYVENTRRDVLGLFPLITPTPEHANLGRLTDSVLDTGRPIYFIKPMPGLEIKYQLESAEPLVRVLGQPAATPQNLSNAMVGNRVRVLGYDVVRESDALRVAVYWSPRAKLDRDYTTFVHLLDARGNKVAQGNDHAVGGEFYPTSLWQVGETLRDEFVIPLPSNLAHDTYRLLVGMYHPPEGEMLGEPVMVGEAKVR